MYFICIMRIVSRVLFHLATTVEYPLGRHDPRGTLLQCEDLTSKIGRRLYVANMGASSVKVHTRSAISVHSHGPHKSSKALQKKSVMEANEVASLRAEVFSLHDQVVFPGSLIQVDIVEKLHAFVLCYGAIYSRR